MGKSKASSCSRYAFFILEAMAMSAHVVQSYPVAHAACKHAMAGDGKRGKSVSDSRKHMVRSMSVHQEHVHSASKSIVNCNA